MKEYIKYSISLILALSALPSCSKIEPWEEGGVVFPNRVHYSVKTTELIDVNDGVSVINEELLRYDISFYDDNSVDRGTVSVIASRDADSFQGDYSVSSTVQAGSLVGGSIISEDGTGTDLRESVVIAQNGLKSLSVTVSGQEVISFAKGAGVPEHQRDANEDCCKKYLINHSSEYAGAYVHTLSVGAKGVTCTEGQYYDTYTGEGDYLILKFVSSSETLGEGRFTAAAMDKAVSGNFMAGKLIDSGMGFSYLDGSQFYTLKEGETYPVVAQAVTGGDLQITIQDAEKEIFTVSGTLILEDGSIFTISYNGRLTPEPAPERDWNVWKYSVSAVYGPPAWAPVEGIKMFNVAIFDPRENLVALFTPIVNDTDDSFLGEFTVAEFAAASGLMGNGYEYMGNIGGSYFYDDGDLNLINAGSRISIVANEDGSINFKGTSVSVTVNGATVTKDIDIKAYSPDYTKQ